MTEQEAEVYAARLTRIWSVLAPFVIEVDTDGAQIFAPLSQDVELRVDVLGSVSLYYLREIDSDSAILFCDKTMKTQSFLPKSWGETPPESIRHLQSEWMPIFRRGCWLSGCPIEATAHEKVEWVRGFAKEEIE